MNGDWDAVVFSPDNLIKFLTSLIIFSSNWVLIADDDVVPNLSNENDFHSVSVKDNQNQTLMTNSYSSSSGCSEN
ncbi:hypothetical protein BLA29_002420 [Euroglyphus maynei]|uniref:Uncharacterized protein n=1 Tax=Euroglyphus maynei TaxID=6958 RepID=A0A1Y3B0A8_EURMA|nr:hypothetical protein BLA29_002420 [Euroglyphus maynei]